MFLEILGLVVERMKHLYLPRPGHVYLRSTPNKNQEGIDPMSSFLEKMHLKPRLGPRAASLRGAAGRQFGAAIPQSLEPSSNRLQPLGLISVFGAPRKNS